jgi:hypothetical protein
LYCLFLSGISKNKQRRAIMAKTISNKPQHITIPKKTAQGGTNSSLKMSSMNKSQRRSHKAYRGQGR